MNTPTPIPGATITLTAALEFPPRTVSGADPDASSLQRYHIGQWSQAVRVGARCDSGGCTMAVRIYFLDSAGAPLGVVAVQFTSASAPDWAGLYIASASADPCWPLAGAKAIAVKVDSVSGGGWTLVGAMT